MRYSIIADDYNSVMERKVREKIMVFISNNKYDRNSIFHLKMELKNLLFTREPYGKYLPTHVIEAKRISYSIIADNTEKEEERIKKAELERYFNGDYSFTPMLDFFLNRG